MLVASSIPSNGPCTRVACVRGGARKLPRLTAHGRASETRAVGRVKIVAFCQLSFETASQLSMTLCYISLLRVPGVVVSKATVCLINTGSQNTGTSDSHVSTVGECLTTAERFSVLSRVIPGVSPVRVRVVGSWGEVYVLSMKVAVLTMWKRVVGLIVRGYIRLALKLREVRRSFVSVMMKV